MGGRETLSEREAEADWTEVQTPESALQKLDIAASIVRSFSVSFLSRETESGGDTKDKGQGGMILKFGMRSQESGRRSCDLGSLINYSTSVTETLSLDPDRLI